MLPVAFKLKNSGLIVPTRIESHEQAGNHPLLLSDLSQARMGLVKNMRTGTVYMQDHKDFLPVYRAKGTGLKVVCISNFPKEAEIGNPELYVPSVRHRCKLVDEYDERKRLPVEAFQSPIAIMMSLSPLSLKAFSRSNWKARRTGTVLEESG